jgi:hypothetical protein
MTMIKTRSVTVKPPQSSLYWLAAVIGLMIAANVFSVVILMTSELTVPESFSADSVQQQVP